LIIQKNNFKNLDDFFMEKSIYASDSYYQNNEIGKDFVTSPEISQIFGELIALKIFEVALKNNININIIEFGGGNGTLMFDVVSTLNKLLAKYSLEGILLKIDNLIMLEKSTYLKNLQKNKLANFDIKKKWIENIDDLIDGVDFDSGINIVLANEFLDALLPKQFIFKNNQWFEILVREKINPQNNSLALDYAICHSPTLLDASDYLNPKNNDVLEISIIGEKFIKKICEIFNKKKCYMLFIDYGYCEYKFGSSLQAMQSHKLVDINTNYNKADITYLVNFLRFKKIFENYNFKVNLATQRNFLLKLGFETRLENLSKNIVDVNEKQIFIANNKKVVDEKSMGDLFKVMEVF
jgi:SAM-dependent MidA family methyltransferase